MSRKETIVGVGLVILGVGLAGIGIKGPWAVVLVVGGIIAVVVGVLPWRGPKRAHDTENTGGTKSLDADARRAIRAALTEQLENARAWFTRDPARGDPALQHALRDAEPMFADLTALHARIDLPPDLGSLLIWLRGAAKEDYRRFQEILEIAAPTKGVGWINPSVHNEARAVWSMIVDRLQVLAALVASEARRLGLEEVATAYDAAPWVTVLEGPPREREMRWATDCAPPAAPHPFRRAQPMPMRLRSREISPAPRRGRDSRLRFTRSLTPYGLD